MNERRLRFVVAMILVAAVAAGCAVRPKPDPRNPAPVRDTPWLLRVCFIEGYGAHLQVGDQVELTTNALGRLRIRHIPGRDNKEPPWNGGEDIRVKSAVLVERVDPSGSQTATRRFVPVGRFKAQSADGGKHERFDFLLSKAVTNLENETYPECDVERGADEVIIRGVDDNDRHGGDVHVRYGP
jgi:hypothetical protein